MNNTVLFTPSTEQLKDIAQSDPELFNRIRNDIISELQKGATKFIQSKLRSKAEKIYSELYTSTEHQLFTPSNYWKNVSSKFNPELEKKFTQKISEKLSDEINTEFERMLESSDFKLTIKNKVKEQMLAIVLKDLDEQIKSEAKKITG